MRARTSQPIETVMQGGTAPRPALVALALFVLLPTLGAAQDPASEGERVATAAHRLTDRARATLFARARTVEDGACEDFEPGRIVVRFRERVPARRVREAADEARASVRSLSPLGLRLLTFDADRAETLERYRALARRDDVAAVTLDCRGSGGVVGSSDSFAADQWHLDNPEGIDIDAVEAWQRTTGSDQIVVAVADSGYDLDHPDLRSRVVTMQDDPENGIDDDGDGYTDDQTGWDWIGGDRTAEDEHSHGSWVAGVLGASTDNEFGVAGLDPSARIDPLKILDADGWGRTSALAAALDYVLLHPQIRVVNLSLVGFPRDPLLESALDAVAEQAIVVACAGNDGPGTADDQYPGAHPATISVGATNRSDQIAAFSSSGSTVDVTAPGEDIVTLEPFSGIDSYDLVEGCSFATPLVAGAASLTLSIRPGTDGDDFRFLLRRSVVDLGTPGWDEDFGWGRLDVDDLLREADELVFQGGFESGSAARWQ